MPGPSADERIKRFQKRRAAVHRDAANKPTWCGHRESALQPLSRLAYRQPAAQQTPSLAMLAAMRRAPAQPRRKPAGALFGRGRYPCVGTCRLGCRRAPEHRSNLHAARTFTPSGAVRVLIDASFGGSHAPADILAQGDARSRRRSDFQHSQPPKIPRRVDTPPWVKLPFTGVGGACPDLG